MERYLQDIFHGNKSSKCVFQLTMSFHNVGKTLVLKDIHRNAFLKFPRKTI